MKLSWLEDFLALTQTGSFSKAASLRNISQPAFSRRVRMLEQWLGVELVSRNGQRPRLTRVAIRFEDEVRNLAERVHELRSQMRAEELAERRIFLTTQHTLMITHLPKLLRYVGARGHGAGFRVMACNRRECVSRFVHDGADLLLCFEVDGEPAFGARADVKRLVVGKELMLPVTAMDDADCPGDTLKDGQPLRLLRYPEDSFLGRVVRAQCLATLSRRYSVETVCESGFTVGIKQMALAGMGMAWLPQGLVGREIADGALKSLRERLPSPELMVVLYRSGRQASAELEDVWRLLSDGPLTL